jgi:hypothetical protein
LDIQTAESALSDLGPGPSPVERSSAGTAPSAEYLNAEVRQRVLNLMRFEDLHDWLAPTGTDLHRLEFCVASRYRRAELITNSR